MNPYSRRGRTNYGASTAQGGAARTIDARLPDARNARLRNVQRDISGNIVGGQDVLSGEQMDAGRGNMSVGGMGWLDEQKAKRAGEVEGRRSEVEGRRSKVEGAVANPFAPVGLPAPAGVRTPSGKGIGDGPFIAPGKAVGDGKAEMDYAGLTRDPRLPSPFADTSNTAVGRFGKQGGGSPFAVPAGAPVLNDGPGGQQVVTRATAQNPYANDPQALGIRAQLVREGRINADGSVPEKNVQPSAGQDPHGMAYLNRLAGEFDRQTSEQIAGRSSGAGFDSRTQGDAYAKAKAEIEPPAAVNPFQPQVARTADGRAWTADGRGSGRPDNGIATAGSGVYDNGKQVVGASSPSRAPVNPFANAAKPSAQPTAQPVAGVDKGDPYDSRRANPAPVAGADEDEEERRRRQGAVNPFSDTAGSLS